RRPPAGDRGPRRNGRDRAHREPSPPDRPSRCHRPDASAPRGGDLFALLTDGLPETIDREGRPLDLEAIEEILRDRAAAPLAQAADDVFERARRHGTANDD